MNVQTAYHRQLGAYRELVGEIGTALLQAGIALPDEVTQYPAVIRHLVDELRTLRRDNQRLRECVPLA